MKIIKDATKAELVFPIQFRCTHCFSEFEAEKNEEIDSIEKTATDSGFSLSLQLKCPVCSLLTEEKYIINTMLGWHFRVPSFRTYTESWPHKKHAQLCPKCDGEGVVPSIGDSTSTTRMCPVCEGTKVFVV